MATAPILVNLVLNDSEGNEITSHGYDRDDECDCRDERGHQRAEDTGSECEEEGNEGKTAGNRVEDHDARERL